MARSLARPQPAKGTKTKTTTALGKSVLQKAELPPARTTTRAEQKLDTQRRIRDAARTLFERDGYDATTTDAIARAAGVAKGTVFVHAKDKLDLLMLVMHDELERTVAARLSTLPRKADLVGAAFHVFSGLFEMYAARRSTSSAFLTQYFSADGPNSARLNALTFTFLQRMAEIVRGAQSRSEVARDVDPMLLASNFFASYWLCLMGWAGNHMPQEQALDTLKRSLMLQVRGLKES